MDVAIETPGIKILLDIFNIIKHLKQGVKDFINSWQMKILNKSTEPLHRKGGEDSNLQISSGSGTSSNQERPIIPNFGTAADLNFRQEPAWPGGNKTGNFSS